MPSDRELLELAARAAGIETAFWNDGQEPFSSGLGFILPSNRLWNPLDDDGDALRLAVKLNLTTVFHPALGQALCRPYWSTAMGDESREDVEKHAHDPYAATRRAIVRAAAKLAQAHPDHKDGGAA